MKNYFENMNTESSKREDLEEMKNILNSMLDSYDSKKSHEEKMADFATQEKKLSSFLENYAKNAR